MRVLGVSGTGEILWLACADDDGLVECPSFRIDRPAGLESGDGLIAAREDACRVMRALDVERVVLLSAGNDGRHPMGYHAAVPRITMEAVVAFAAAEEGIPFDRVSRPTAKVWLGLPAAGSIDDYVNDLIATPQNPYWKKKRDLAAMAALAGVAEARAQLGHGYE